MRFTPGEIEQQSRVQEAMRKYEEAEREWDREVRLQLWKGIAWALALTTIAALAVLWVMKIFRFS